MNRARLTPEQAVGRFLESLAEPGTVPAEVDRSADRMLRFLEKEYETLPKQRVPVWYGDGQGRGLRWVAVAAVAAVLALALVLWRVDTQAVASVESGIITAVEQGESRTVSEGGALSANVLFRVGGARATVSFADGSRVELNSDSAFSIVRVSDGTELRLANGNVIVTAAKQKNGHLYVRTPDCNVSVTGTVFSVRAEATGSRISVFEGQVRVMQRDRSYTLSRGEQLATSPVLGAPGLEAEVQWSRNAPALLALLQAPEQSTAVLPGAESIEGIVTNVATGAPLAGVTVLVAAPRSPRVLFEVKSGSDGRFKVEKVPSGSYSVVTSEAGFWALSGAVEITVSKGQSVRGLRLGMSQAAKLSGRVVAENGQPVRSLTLSLRVLSVGDRTLRSTNTGAIGGVTNDKGEYEFTDVLPGTYYIRTSASGSGDVGIYYPGSLDVDRALPVELRPGESLTGINLVLPSVKLYSIRFEVPKDSLRWFERVFGAPGPRAGLLAAGHYERSGATFSTPLLDQIAVSKVVVSTPPGFTLQSLGKLVDEADRSVIVPGMSRLTSLGNDAYVLRGVTPGKYHLRLRWDSGYNPFEPRSDGTYKQSWALVDTEVEIVDKDVDLGKLASKPDNVSIPVRFTYADGIPSEVAVIAASTQRFGGTGLLNSLAPTLRLNGLGEGTYSLEFKLAKSDRYISLARYGVQDLLSDPLVVDSSDHGAMEVVVDGPAGSVEGIVRDAKGEPIQGVSVVLFPPQYRRANRSLFQAGRTDQDGKFRFSGLAPGDYGVYSWESAPNQAYFDADWLRNYGTRGTTVAVRKGQTSNANVRLIPAMR